MQGRSNVLNSGLRRKSAISLYHKDMQKEHLSPGSEKIATGQSLGFMILLECHYVNKLLHAQISSDAAKAKRLNQSKLAV